jgi:hypothetical protein
VSHWLSGSGKAEPSAPKPKREPAWVPEQAQAAE